MSEANNQKGREQYEKEYTQSRVVLDLTNKEIRRLEKKIKKLQKKVEVYKDTQSNIKMLPVADLLIDPIGKNVGERLFPNQEISFYCNPVSGAIAYLEMFWVADNTVHCLIVYQDNQASPDLTYLGHPTGKKIEEGSIAIGYREDRHHLDLPDDYDEIANIVLNLYSKDNYDLFLSRYPEGVKLFT